MNEIKLLNQDGKVLVSSRVVAEDFGKRHADVLRNIEEIITQNSVVTTMYVETTYQAGTGKAYKEYLMNRDGFSLLVMGFTGKDALQFKLQYIEAFNKMEQALTQPKQLTQWEMMKWMNKRKK